MLPAMAVLLNYKSVDSRVVSFIGLVFILAACIGSAFVTVYWNRDQFFIWEACQAIGQPMVIMPLLMMATNTVTSPAEGPFASSLVNTSRAVAEAVAAWLFALIDRWRGALHSDRIVDQIGQERWQAIQGNSSLPRAQTSFDALAHAVDQQVTILSTSDTFVILACLTLFVIVVLLILPVRTMPPRIQFGKH